MKIKLPKNVRIIQITTGTYSLEYGKFCWEPTLEELAKIKDVISKLLERFKNNLIKFSYDPDNRFLIFVRYFDVTAGIGFKCENDIEELESIFGIENVVIRE